MQCPRCKQLDDKVIESRSLAGGRSIRRRRECLACGYRFTSYERIEEKPLMVIKKNSGRREPFDRGKIEKGIEQAVRKRPVSQLQLENALDDLEEQIMVIGRSSHEISSAEIGKMVLDKLYHLDRVAYVRFASVYRNFENVEEFVREIETLSGMKQPQEQQEDGT
ncbi:MAG: transcriptional regulator NrdR [Spirochaetaceae bacterium]